jgi:hypothetical protein
MNPNSLQKKVASLIILGIQLYLASHLAHRWVHWTFTIGTCTLLLAYLVAIALPEGTTEVAKAYIKPNGHLPAWLDVVFYGYILYLLWDQKAYCLDIAWFGLLLCDLSARYSASKLISGTKLNDQTIQHFFDHWDIVRPHLTALPDSSAYLGLDADWGIEEVESLQMDNGKHYTVFCLLYRKVKLAQIKQVGTQLFCESPRLSHLAESLHPALEQKLLVAGIRPLPKPTDPFDL